MNKNTRARAGKQILRGLFAASLFPIASWLPALAAPEPQETKTVGGQKVSIVKLGEGHFEVFVDGKTVLTNEDDSIVTLKGSYISGGRRYVLIAEISGGTACPALYQAINLSGPTPVISPRLGNCSDLPKVSVTGGILRIAFPRFGDAPAKIETFGDETSLPPPASSGTGGDLSKADTFLRQLYAGYIGGPAQNTPDPTGPKADMLFDPELLGLIRRDQELANGEIGLLDVDPICNCQDWDNLRVLRIVVRPKGAVSADATVSFVNTGHRQVLNYQLVNLGGQWRIHDVRSGASPSLREYLTAGLAAKTHH